MCSNFSTEGSLGKRHIDSFDINVLPPRPKAPQAGLPERSVCALFPGKKTHKKGTHIIICRGDVWVERGPKQAILGHKRCDLPMGLQDQE